MNNQYALVVFSGGMDSTTALLWARREFSGVSAVSFSYGAKHNARELAAANVICRKLNIPRLEIPLDFIGKYFHSSLLKTGGSIPEGAYNETNMASTVVPFRNGIMLAAAAGLAEDSGIPPSSSATTPATTRSIPTADRSSSTAWRARSGRGPRAR